MDKLQLFGTSGIRGSAEERFTNQFCFDLGRTFSLFLDQHQQEGKIAVGMDPRPSSDRIKSFFIAGLIHEGKEVRDEEITPVPSMNWLLKAGDFIASAMITGSHIKANLNGIKFFAFGEEILKEHEREIEEIYAEIAEKIPVPQTTTAVPLETQAKNLYQEMLIEKSAKPYPEWKVVVDPGNGAQSEVIPEVLQNSGLKLIIINADLKNNSIARDTEVEEDFASLKEEVVKNQANLGIAYDADGDRVAFVDKNGQFIPGDYIGSLLGKYEETREIVTPINVSQVVETLGKKVIRTKVGSPYVVAKMKETNAKFGFEANGGGFFAETMLTRDGGLVTIKILNLMKSTQKNLDQLLGQLPKFYNFKDKVECPWEYEQKVLNEARAKFSGERVEEVDGLKIWPTKDSWVLFRSSKNAPEFRVFAEARTQEEAIKLGNDGLQLVKEVISHGE